VKTPSIAPQVPFFNLRPLFNSICGFKTPLKNVFSFDLGGNDHRFSFFGLYLVDVESEAQFSDAMQKVSTMPIFASEPATTVRQHSPWLLSKMAYAAVFLTVTLAAYGWKLFNAHPPKVDLPLQVTAKVCVHHPNFAFQHALQETLAQARTEVRENLHVECQPSGQTTVVAITLSNLPAETLVPVVNMVASAYSQACRAEWKLQLEQAYSVVQTRMQQVERRLFEAQRRFELLRDRQLRALSSPGPVSAPQPAMVENPAWTKLSHRLAELEEHKRVLLLECTPLHPSVQEADHRITDVLREMASIPAKIAQDPPVVLPASILPPDGPDASEVEAAQQAVERVKQDLQQAQAIERAAIGTRGEELKVDLIASEPLPTPSAPPHADAITLGKALVIATTSVVGLGMISLGASLEPAISSIGQLQAILPAPVVGVIPATYPSRRSTTAPQRRRLARWGWITAGLVVLFVVVLLFFRG